MSAENRILVVDDEANMRRVLEAYLSREGFDVDVAEDGHEALNYVSEKDYTVVITDLKMPKMDGLELFDAIRSQDRHLPVIVITAHGTVETAVDAMKKGALDYITKPFEADQIKLAVEKAVRSHKAAEQEFHLDDPAMFRSQIVGESPPMQEVYELIEKVAESPTTVLVTGETGTGKELVAEALHRLSDRSSKPFVPIHCAAIPETLLESELFGHVRGAFTGAVTDKPGKMELADEGTLFLDEVGELPIEIQVKLLRCLQHRAFERVGGLRTVEVDVRLVVATNKNLLEAVEQGSFRQDLFYRLNVFPIHLPPLRERKSDIPLLVRYFLDRFSNRLGKDVEGISEAAINRLMAHDWPGNIRELENAIERSILMCDGHMIEESDVSSMFESSNGENLAGVAVEEALAAATDPSGTSLKEVVRKQRHVTEKIIIERALQETEGNVTHAANNLGISRKSLQTKMKKYGLRKDE